MVLPHQCLVASWMASTTQTSQREQDQGYGQRCRKASCPAALGG
jgi:hypothetical protein